MISGARQARPSWFRRLVALAAARELSALVLPGTDVARARGLDLRAAGLRLSSTPRHASVLVLVGDLPAGLRKAAAIAYAQMPRPRAILAVGAGDISPLPGPDATVELEQEALARGVAELRRSFAEGAFDPDALGFDVEAIRSRTEYVCPMHPEVVREEPGECPICGMDLVPREAAGETEHGDEHHGDAGHQEHAAHGGGGEVAAEYTCPMHPEVVRGEPGSCPICGMDLVPRGEDSGEGGADRGEQGGEAAAHAAHGQENGSGEGDGHEHADDGDHGGMEHGEQEGGGEVGHDHMDHGDMGFMSMVEMTKDLPRSSDGLQMEWVEAPFGPLFPGLPAGLSLTLTLDGDTVAEADAEPGIEGWSPLEGLSGPAEIFAERLSRIDPLSPVAYRVLASRAVEDAAGAAIDERTALARAGAVERERAASHLNWLAGFAHLLGYSWLEEQAGELQLALLRAAGPEDVARLAAEAKELARRVERTPLLRRRLERIGTLPADAEVSGPVARARGSAVDARRNEEAYRLLGFEPIVLDGNDALSRLWVRLAEIERSLNLVRKAGSVSVPEVAFDGRHSGTGTATVETPRGAATLSLILDEGTVVAFDLDTPSTLHLGLIKPVSEQREVADALVGIASLDLSPWEVVR